MIQSERLEEHGWIFEEPLCRSERYLSCTQRESRVLHGKSQNEMFARCAD